jgi:hypothetical protein
MNYLDCMVNFMQLRHALSGLKILKKPLRPAQRPLIHHVAARFSVSSNSPIGVTAGNIGACAKAAANEAPLVNFISAELAASVASCRRMV